MGKKQGRPNVQAAPQQWTTEEKMANPEQPTPGYHNGKRIKWVKLDSKGTTDPAGECTGPRLMKDAFTPDSYSIVIQPDCIMIGHGKNVAMVPMRRVMEVMLEGEGGE